VHVVDHIKLSRNVLLRVDLNDLKDVGIEITLGRLDRNEGAQQTRAKLHWG